VDQVVFGTPFCKDFESIKKLGEALKNNYWKTKI
jgi:hypothetical protein